MSSSMFLTGLRREAAAALRLEAGQLVDLGILERRMAGRDDGGPDAGMAGLEGLQDGHARVLEVVDGEEDLISGVIEAIERLQVGGHVVVDVLDRLEKADERISFGTGPGRLRAPAEGHREGREQGQDRPRKGQQDEDHGLHRILL